MNGIMKLGKILMTLLALTSSLAIYAEGGKSKHDFDKGIEDTRPTTNKVLSDAFLPNPGGR